MSLSYNNVDLSYVLTQSLDQSPEMDPSGGVDQTLTKMTFRVRAVIGPEGLPPAAPGEQPGDVLRRVRHLLTQPRKRLVYKSPDGVTIVDTGASGVDDGAGPVVESFDCHQVLEGCIIVSLAVTVRLVDCTSTPKAWLSNRFSESTTYDAEWRCRKTRQGVLVLSSRSKIDPDGLRGLIAPPVSPGFRREVSEYERDPSTLIYRYRFQDVELFRPPPLPATRMTGRMTESTPLAGGMRVGEISLKMSGPKTIAPKEMLNAAIRVAVNRALASGINRTKAGRMMIGGAISESLDDDKNEVELALKWNIKPTPGRETGQSDGSLIGSVIRGALGGGVGQIGRTDPAPNDQGRDTAGLSIGYGGWVGKPLAGSDPARAISHPTFGTAPDVRIIAAALNDPCTAQMAVSELRSGPAANQYTGTRAGQTVLVTTNVPLADLPDDLGALYTDDGPGTYDKYTVTTIYKYSSGRQMLGSTKKGEPAQLVQLRNETMRIRVEWAASRVGGPPAIPSRDPPGSGSGPSNVEFLEGSVGAEGLDLAADGVSAIHSISGIYEYGVRNPAEVTVGAPIPPYLDLTVAPEAVRSAGLVAADILFPVASAVGAVTNVLTGKGLQVVQRAAGVAAAAIGAGVGAALGGFTPDGRPAPGA